MKTITTNKEHWESVENNRFGKPIGRYESKRKLPTGESFNTYRLRVTKSSDACCFVCASKQRLELEHRIPVFCGGDLLPSDDDQMNNFTVLCVKCHRVKSVRDRVIAGIMKKVGMLEGKSPRWLMHCSLDESIEFYLLCEKHLLNKERVDSL